VSYLVVPNKEFALNLKRTLGNIRNYHLCCAIFLQISYVIEMYNITSHSNIYFKSLTLPMYIYIILKCQYQFFEIVEEENQGCFSNQLGNAKQWIFIELSIFYSSMLVLIIFLIYSYCKKNFEDMTTISKRNLHILDELKL